MKSSELAYEAARIMSERGHCKNITEDDEGRVCYQGALLQATLGRTTWNDIPRDLYQIICDVGAASQLILCQRGIGYPDPVEYNNREDITGEDVILLLKETGRKLEECGE
jgi:hypothetical protein